MDDNNVVVVACCLTCCMNQKKRAIMITRPKLSFDVGPNIKVVMSMTAIVFLHASENSLFGIPIWGKHIVFGMKESIYQPVNQSKPIAGFRGYLSGSNRGRDGYKTNQKKL